MSVGAATITADAVEGRKAPVRRYWVRRTLAALCGLLFGLAIFTSPRKGLDLPGDWKEGIALVAALPSVVAMLGYAAGYRPRRGNWFWKTYAWGMLAWCIYEGYEATLVTPNMTDDVALALAILAGTAVFYPFAHLLFRFRAVGRLPEVPDAQPARGWKRWLGLRAERDLWSGAVSHPRWFQFGIAGPALVVTLWCVWLGLKVEQKKSQQAAIRELKAMEVGVAMHDLSELELAVAKYVGDQLLNDAEIAYFRRDPADDDAIELLLQCKCVTNVYFYDDYKPYSDASIRQLGGLSMLSTLSTGTTEITDETLEALCHHETLESLEFESHRITDRGLASIASCQGLRSLTLTNAAVTDDALREVVSLPRLWDLNIANVGINGSCFSSLNESSRLLDVRVRASRLNNDAIRYLRRAPRLRSLTVVGGNLTDGCADDLAGIATLEHVHFSHASIADESLHAICSLPMLEWLSLSDTRIRGESLWRISHLPSLRQLTIRDCPVTDSGFAAIIAKLRTYCPLDVSGTRITDGAFFLCKETSCVQDLNIERTLISDAGVTQLPKFRGLRFFDIENTFITPASDEVYQSMPDSHWSTFDGHRATWRTHVDQVE